MSSQVPPLTVRNNFQVPLKDPAPSCSDSQCLRLSVFLLSSTTLLSQSLLLNIVIRVKRKEMVPFIQITGITVGHVSVADVSTDILETRNQSNTAENDVVLTGMVPHFTRIFYQKDVHSIMALDYLNTCAGHPFSPTCAFAWTSAFTTWSQSVFPTSPPGSPTFFFPLPSNAHTYRPQRFLTIQHHFMSLSPLHLIFLLCSQSIYHIQL